MIRRSAPWFVAAFSLALILCSFLLPSEDWPFWPLVSFTLWIGVTASIGALIATRRRENPVGWALIAMAFSVALGLLTTQYSAFTLEVRPGALPGGMLAAWLQTWLFVPVAGLLLILALWFPTGRLPSPVWRWVFRIGIAGTVGLVASQAFRPGALDALPSVDNPLGVPGARPITDAVQIVSSLALSACVVAAILSVFLRFRRAKGDERQQVKWFTFAIAVLVVCVLCFPLLETIGTFTVGESVLGFFVPFVGLLGVPVSIGVAILRYRLYDIDRIISRTFSYAIVTLLLGGMFAVLVLLPVLIGVDQAPDYVIAAATLIVAALFRPVRRRVQNTVDHRFNRRRYDAARLLESFSATLRQEIDIDALGAELQNVVRSTMQPTHVTVWMRGDVVK